MTHSSASTQSNLPPDDPTRTLVLAKPDTDPTLPHVSVAGDTYTILVAGKDTNGRFAVIDMLVPPGGGPPPHRHDFEETFFVREGEIEVTFRGQSTVAGAGATVSIPANAPHAFKNISDRPARLICTVSPAGQEEFFLAVGDPVPTRTSPPPQLDEAGRAERMKRVKELAPKYRNEMIAP